MKNYEKYLYQSSQGNKGERRLGLVLFFVASIRVSYLANQRAQGLIRRAQGCKIQNKIFPLQPPSLLTEEFCSATSLAFSENTR